MVKVKIGSKVVEYPKGTKVIDIIGDSSLRSEQALAVKVNETLTDLSKEITEDSELELIDFNSLEGRQIFWHSASHLMAQAVKKLFPNAKLAIGPAIEEGFYYDFDFATPLSDEDLPVIEEKMHELVKNDFPIKHRFLKRSEAIAYFSQRNETFKTEILSEIPDEKISVYEQGEFVDLCLGPHIPRTGLIKAFKLIGVAGAYWHGNEKNKMLTRIYGIAFPSSEQLDEYLRKLEEARKRDHRKLGPFLELISIQDEAGAGLVFWHPKGATVRRVIEDYWKSEHLKNGYQLVITPHIFRGKLFRTSGHYEYYRENMFFLPVEKEEYVLKPMNCPGHILIYKSKVNSYRDLPVRFAELGTVYRNERSGVLHGALRVRGITQDDAHIFCSPEQAEDEVYKVIKLALEILTTFGFKEFDVNLSVRDLAKKENYMGDDREWELAENSLQNGLKRIGLSFHKALGEATFYGPKIDINLFDSLGRKWQCPTIQFDFNLAKRFNLYYMAEDGQHHSCLMIHRTILGALERFVAILIEHYAGAFPIWLSPYQATILTVTDNEIPYGTSIFETLVKEGIRTICDFKNEKINYKIAKAEREKIPYILIVGRREVLQKSVSLRKRGAGDLGNAELSSIITQIQDDIQNRR